MGGLTVPFPEGLDPDQPLEVARRRREPPPVAIDFGQIDPNAPMSIDPRPVTAPMTPTSAQLKAAQPPRPTPEQAQAMAAAGAISPGTADQFASPGQRGGGAAPGLPAGFSAATPAGKKLARTQRKFGRDIKASEKALGEAQEDVSQAVARQGAIQAGVAAQTAEALGRRNAEIMKLDQQQKRIDTERNKAVGEITGKINSLTEEVAGFELDPQRMFAGPEGTARKIGAGIAIALGAIGSGLAGGPNRGMDVINQAIDKDLDVQKAQFQQKKQQLGAQKSLLAVNTERFGSLQAGVEATRIQQMEATARRIEALQAASQSPLAKEKAAEAAGQIRAQAAERKTQLSQQLQDSREKSILRQEDLRQTNASAAAKAIAAQQSRMIGDIELPPGTSKEQEKLARKAVVEFDKLNTPLVKLIELRKKMGSTGAQLDRDEVKEADGLNAQIRGALKDKLNLGAALTESEMEEFLDKMVPRDASAFGGLTEDRILNQLQRFQRNQFETTNKELENTIGVGYPEDVVVDFMAP